MIYDYMLKPSIVESFGFENINQEESEAMIKYLDETFLVESSFNLMIERIINDLRKVERMISDDKDPDEIKTEIEKVYEQAKILGSVDYGETEDYNKKNLTTAKISAAISVLGILALKIIKFKSITTVKWISIITVICGIILVITAGSEKEGKFDATYDLLIQSESKYLVEKRKAKKAKDINKEKCCDKMIEMIEDLKTKRRHEYTKKQSTNESNIITESEKHEIDINNFKQAIDEINRLLTATFDGMRKVCDTTLSLIRLETKTTASNVDKIIDKMIKIAKDADKDLNSYEPINDRLTRDLFNRYNKFYTRYSRYGLKVRDRFEEKLAKYNNEVIEYINNFYDQISELVYGSKGHNINDMADTMYNKLVDIIPITKANKINNIMISFYNDHFEYTDFIEYTIYWYRQRATGSKIKNTLRYKIISKFVK